jgi:hypothetical protein
MLLNCKTCGKDFESKKGGKKFCCLKCYHSSADFRDMIARNMEAGRSKGNGPKRKGTYSPCLVCGAEIYKTAQDEKRGKKTCSRLCYRKYMAERFDRNIGAVENIEQLSNYDEFLSSDVLCCLVDWCNWRGHNLSLHMNQSHGIKARDFKMAAGFNLSTGVVSAQMQQNLVDRCNKGGAVDNSIAIAARTFTYRSREGKEHLQKSMMLRERNDKGQFVTIL